jgi:hypothetical protein
MDPDQPAHPRSLFRIHAVRLPTLLQVEKLIANRYISISFPLKIASYMLAFFFLTEEEAVDKLLVIAESREEQRKYKSKLHRIAEGM